MADSFLNPSPRVQTKFCPTFTCNVREFPNRLFFGGGTAWRDPSTLVRKLIKEFPLFFAVFPLFSFTPCFTSDVTSSDQGTIPDLSVFM